MPIISGTLKDGAGQPIAGCTIQLKAMNTTSAVIRSTTARVGANAGAYSIDAQPGRYEVTLAVEDYPPHKVGVIDVYADSPDGTLNDFLTATKAEYLTPDVMNQFKLLAQQSREAAEAAGVASQGVSTIKDAAEKAASNAALSEINAAGSVTKTAASAAAALVSQNAAKTSEDAASASAVKASVSEVNAYYSAAAALASQKAAKVSEDAAKASQIASTASADAASASAMSAQGNATRSTQAATDAIAAKDAAAAQVTGFDEYVSQQVTVITEVVASATTKANADIAAATDISRNNAILAINQKQAEATGAIQVSVDTAVTTAQTAALSASASQVAATASASGANTSAIAAQASATAAKASQNAATLFEVNARKSATDAQAYALTVTQQAAQIQSTATEIANQGRLVTEQSLRTQENAEKVVRSELNIQQKASTVEFAFNKLGPLVIDPATGASVDISAKVSGFATRAETAAASAEASNVEAQKASTTAARDTAQKLLPLLTELSTTVEGVKTKTDAEVARLTASAALAVTNAEKSSTSASVSAQQAQQALEEARLIARLPLPGEVGSYVFAEADGGGYGFGGEVEGEWLHPTAHIGGDFWMNEGTLLTGTWVAAGYFLDVGRQKTLFMRIR
ncbi:hypothetical protein LO27_27055 [Salmonella enterica]|nr:hypothetical protein [Salmonella enterica]